MRTRSYQLCTRCVMDTTDLEITFDEKGWCNHCTGFLNKGTRHKYQGEESDRALDDVIDAIKRSGKRAEYDCIIGVSGGADSSYMAYIAKQQGLRPLAVHMDNGWDSDKAVTNIKNVTKKLEIDYESYVLDWEELKDLQLAFLKASVPEAETPTDVAIAASLHYFAAKYNIKYIISGGNLATEAILPKSWHYDVKDLKYFRYIHKTFGSGVLKGFPTFGYKKEMYYKLVKGIRMLYPLNSVPFVKTAAMKLLSEQLEWQPYGGKHHESRYTMFIQSYYLYEKFGIDYRRVGLATQICTGEVSRGDAIGQLETRPYEIEQINQEKQYISKKLGVSLDEFESIIGRPPKWYWDYPNDEKQLSFIYDVYRKLFGKEKLDRF